MGDMFRSEKMSLCQVFIQPEAAYNTLAQLGELGCVQFHDLNQEVLSFQKNFVGEVRRCEELERQIGYIESELKKDEIKITEIVEDLPPAPQPREIVGLETQLEKIENELIEISKNQVNLKTNYLELIELRKVLESAHDFFLDQEVITFEANNRNVSIEERERAHLGFLAGVLNRERAFAFERMLWRISRGNIYIKRSDVNESIKDPKTGFPVYRTVFVIFFQGEQLRNRIKKICTGFHASMYTCPGAQQEREDMLRSVTTRIDDLKVVIAQSEDHRNVVLGGVAKQLEIWSIMVTKMKAIYHTLNLFSMDVSQNCLIGEGWIPDRDLELVRETLAEGAASVGSPVPSFINVLSPKGEPPTYYRTNKFTRGFQNLIDAYGMASYREVNPALYTCITFPFLFAVMFGDLGHGLILFSFGFWMVIDEKRLGKKRGGEIWNIFFTGRYIIMLMGLFAMYTGFLYNEVYSISMNVFGSQWRIRYNTSTVLNNTDLQLDPTVSTVGVYPMGLDPIWQLASNKIIFTNTYKMKLSIIIAVLHMVFGVCMAVENYVYFKKYALIILEFLPQVLFLLLFFGYMVFMMFFKWVKYSATATELAEQPGCAPSVLIMFINMMLFKENTAVDGCEANMFNIQPLLEKIFVIVAVICIPWLLLGKPLWIQCTRNSNKKRIQALKAQNMDGDGFKIEFIDPELERNKAGVELTIETAVESYESGGYTEEEEEPMSEIWIHQAIHTIEYILSTISHTASYLRLWALSLAHSQLSDVLWNMVMSYGFTLGLGYVYVISLFFIFGAWAVLTIAIMIMMEGLSAFLHTLRLHWVEFMSKFYVGAGYAFQPFSFKKILAETDED